MANVTPSSVTLIFYKLGLISKEPFLNILASAMQMSSLCHCEIAIGEATSIDGAMINVARVFNDAVGVELTARTGRNPNYCYVQLGCTERAVQRMTAFARAQIGKPFSQIGMARSIFYPRETDRKSWYCAELTAAILQVGGLLHPHSNPGAATPSSLYAMYAPRAAVAANPFKLHLLQQQRRNNTQTGVPVNAQLRREEEPMLQLNLRGTLRQSAPGRPMVSQDAQSRQHFRHLQSETSRSLNPSLLTAGLTLNSLMPLRHSRS